MMRKMGWALMCTMLLAVVSCEKSDDVSDTTERVILVYMGGDNNLSTETTQKINAMLNGWIWGQRRLFVYQDAQGAKPRLLRIRGGCTNTPEPYIDLIREYDEEDSASSATLARVIREVLGENPADSYGLVVFSHASGWLPAGTLENPNLETAHGGTRSMITDGNNEMELADFAAAIPDNRFDFIAFETCFSAGAEVAYLLRNKADYVLTSSAEIVSPGFTPIYSSAIMDLFNTKIAVWEALRNFGLKYYTYVNGLTGVYKSTTLSIVKTGEMDELARLTKQVLASSGIAPDIDELQHFDRPGSYGDRPVSPRFFDYGQYMEQVATADQYNSIARQLEKTVVWKIATPEFMKNENGFTINRHSGLTVYIEQPVFPGLNAAYRSQPWYQATH